MAVVNSVNFKMQMNNRNRSEFGDDLLREKITGSLYDQQHLTRNRCYRITQAQQREFLITANHRA